MYIMEVNIRPSMQQKSQGSGSITAAGSAKDKAEQKRRDERDVQILKTMWTMIAYGLSIFLGGFAVWGLDNVYCGTLIQWRRELGLPWGILLEGHGWWYVYISHSVQAK